MEAVCSEAAKEPQAGPVPWSSMDDGTDIDTTESDDCSLAFSVALHIFFCIVSRKSNVCLQKIKWLQSCYTGYYKHFTVSSLKLSQVNPFASVGKYHLLLYDMFVLEKPRGRHISIILL